MTMKFTIKYTDALIVSILGIISCRQESSADTLFYTKTITKTARTHVSRENQLIKHLELMLSSVTDINFNDLISPC